MTQSNDFGVMQSDVSWFPQMLLSTENIDNLNPH